MISFKELTTPSSISKEKLFVPKGYDLPYEIQVVKAENCNVYKGEPYDFAGHEVTMAIFPSEFAGLDEAIVTFEDGTWTRRQSPGQDTPVNDTLFRVIEWSELDDLSEGQEYWYRFWAEDDQGVVFGLKRGAFFKGKEL